MYQYIKVSALYSEMVDAYQLITRDSIDYFKFCIAIQIILIAEHIFLIQSLTPLFTIFNVNPFDPVMMHACHPTIGY